MGFFLSVAAGGEREEREGWRRAKSGKKMGKFQGKVSADVVVGSVGRSVGKQERVRERWMRSVAAVRGAKFRHTETPRPP